MKEVLKMKMENLKKKNNLHHWKAEEKIRRKRLSNNFFKYFLVSYSCWDS